MSATAEDHSLTRVGGAATDNASWPAEVELILSAIETGRHRCSNRRGARRIRYRVRGHLRLFSDDAATPPRVIYTRDVHARGLGFITPTRMPLGHGGLVHLPRPNGDTLAVHCTLLRCREAAPGWFEGAVYFNREQPELATP